MPLIASNGLSIKQTPEPHSGIMERFNIMAKTYRTTPIAVRIRNGDPALRIVHDHSTGPCDYSPETAGYGSPRCAPGSLSARCYAVLSRSDLRKFGGRDSKDTVLGFERRQKNKSGRSKANATLRQVSKKLDEVLVESLADVNPHRPTPRDASGTYK